MTILNDLRERVAGYVITCPDKDLMKLDIAALAKRGRRPQPKKSLTGHLPAHCGAPGVSLFYLRIAKKIVFFAHFFEVLVKKVNAEPCDITVMFTKYMGTTFIGYKNMEITSRIFTYLRIIQGISLKELAEKFACKRVKELDEIFESILLCKLDEYLAIVKNRENRNLETNREVTDTQSGRSGEDELKGFFTQPALSPHQN